MKYSLFEHEEDLPRLPVPLLTQSTHLILAALKPLLSAEEYSEILNEASQLITNKTVLLIQRHLEAAAANPDVTCYLNAVNGESYPGIYGDLNGDILPRNPFLVLEEDPYAQTINPPNQAQRTASLVNSALKFIVSLRNQTLKPDVTPKLGTPLTMKCYMNLFGTTRVPDELQEYHHLTIAKYKHFNDSRHVLFICNNQYYTLEVLTPCEDVNQNPKHQIWFNDAELAPIVQEIIDRSSLVDLITAVNNGIGAITTQTYGYWKQARVELKKTSPEYLETVDNALFVVALDTSSAPKTDQEKTQVISHGTSRLFKGTNIQIGSCTSRWYDKLQMVVTSNAVAGVVWESSLMDSTAILRFISDIYTDSILKLARNINGAENTLFDESVQFVSGKDSDVKPTARELSFKMTPELQHLIHLSETRLADLLNQHEYRSLTMKVDSHVLLKSGLLADSFLQVGFQVAHYALYGRVANTLEPITTRKFRDARTDLVAVQNEAINNLAKLFITSADNEKKWQAFRACAVDHTKNYRSAMLGQGFERHIGAMLQVLRKPSAVDSLNKLNKDVKGLEPIPPVEVMADEYIPFLSNESIERLTAAELLISNCGNPALHLFGISPAIDQGFGIGYIIHKDKVVVTVSSKFRQTERFLSTFRSVVKEMKNIVRQVADLWEEMADSETRKYELKRLRIEKELKNVNKDLYLTRHPIDLRLDSTALFKLPESPKREITPTLAQEHSSNSDDNKDDEFNYLGGYGYFDVGEVDIRRDELVRDESFRSTNTSSLTSRTGSRVHSSGNLHQMGKQLGFLQPQMMHLPQQPDIKQKMSLNDQIRDRLQPDILSPSLDELMHQSELPFDLPQTKKKNMIGRQVLMLKF